MNSFGSRFVAWGELYCCTAVSWFSIYFCVEKGMVTAGWAGLVNMFTGVQGKMPRKVASVRFQILDVGGWANETVNIVSSQIQMSNLVLALRDS